MEKTYETKEKQEKFILVGVDFQGEKETLASMKELEDLVETAGGFVVGKITQKRERIHPGTYLGKGKTEELQVLVEELQADAIVCDDELSPAQLRNLEDILKIRILDRTQIILDIFAKRATTREGKIQVELAQLKYRAVRLVGMRSSLSRLGGGIGTRGPGEKKLESDRRLIKDRISILKSEIKDVENHREIARQNRKKNLVTVAAIVGYTNAGKSTLLNRLTDAEVYGEDKLFATLDPTTRSLTFASGQEIVFTDTVGFIRKLPHHLIDAFRSTLEEAKFADLIVHVVDASSDSMDAQMETVYQTLSDLGIEGKTIITLFNKQDKCDADRILKDGRASHSILTSLKTGKGIPELLEILEALLRKNKIFISEIFDFKDAGKIQWIRKYGEILKEEYTHEGIYIEGYIPQEILGKIKNT